MDESAPNEYTATLRVFSEVLPRAELEARLGKPTGGHERGDPVSGRYPDGAKRLQASWILESSLARSEKLDLHIEELVAFAESRREIIDSLFSDASIDVYCGVFTGGGLSGGFTIEPALSRRLGELKLPLAIEVY